MDERTTEAIWRACGAAAPLRIGVTPPLPGLVRSVPHPFALVGRDPRCEISLDDDAISRRHALLVVLEGRTFGIDLGSREGTFWGGTARAYGLLEGNATMKVGLHQLQVLRPKAATGGHSAEVLNPMATWQRGRKHATDLVLEVNNPQSRKIRWRIKSFVTMIGRSPDCKLKLMDPSVSSVHCCLICTPMGLWVIDLLGREGIEVNEKPVRYARLADSDDLRVGRFQFRVRGELTPPKGLEANPTSVSDAAAPARFGGASSSSDVGGVAGLPALNGPAGRSVELSTRGPDSADSVLVPFVNALRMLQQHDQDQHHQTMMMLQTIFAVHGEQIGAVRTQLDYVLRILQDSRGLPLDPALAARIAELAGARELTAPPQVSTGPPKRGARPIAVDPSAQIYQLPGAKKVVTRGLAEPKQGRRAEPPSPADIPRPMPGPQAAPPAGSITGPTAPGSASASARATHKRPDVKKGEEPADPSANPEHSVFEDGMHLMMRDRLDEIRRERMTLWQKIIDMVGGS